ncbi:phage tail tape measure protein [Megasphaera elsdenii]|uniref:phage tail tape measure protein n=1 Tax=Megasphaera elsdenii TaxID=907 RepID=UPI001959124C|nr:phage tail tape measure protein [Megasphaera elsdenii]MBM6701769.1 phage tail tape measure protein [Megasphaera elsdenii]
MNADFVLSATIALKDNFTAQVNKAKSGFRDFERSLRGASATIDSTAASMEKSGLAAVKLSQQADRAKRSLTGIRGVYSATVRAKDEATQAVRRIKTELSGLQGKAYTAIVNIRQNGPLQQMRNGLSGMAGGMLMGTSMQMAGAAGIGFGAFNAVQNYSDFTAQLSQIKALTDLDAQTMEQVKAKAMELGDATTFSSTEAAQGMTELLKAGVSVKDVLGDASEAALNLATAGGLGMGEAAEIMSTAMNAFHMDDATHAADILAGAANASATSVQEMRYSLAACSAVAAGAGVSFDDTNTALAVFAQNSLRGSDAGTSLKTMLQSMIPTTQTQMEAFAELNLLTENGTSAFFDASGNMKSMADIAALLQDRLKGLTKEQQMAYLNAMFGSDAIRGGMILMREGAKGVKDMYDAMSKVTAADTAAVMMDNLKGSLNELSSAWENLTIKLLDGGAGDGLSGFIDELTDLTRGFNKALDDGFQFTDLLSTLGDGLKDLKDKALALDGVGSVLAGGALVVGLTKIVSLARRARQYLGDLTKAPSSQPGGGGSGAGDMIVNARTVIVNGTTTPGSGGGGGGAPGKPSPGPARPGMGSRAANIARRLARVGLPLTLLNGALDIAMAPEGQTGAAVGGTVGSTAGWLVGAKAGAATGAGIGSLFGGVGAVPGAAIGGLVVGMAGSFGGGALGQYLGGLDWDNEVQYASQSFDRISAQFAAKNQEWVDAYAQSCAQMQAKGQEWETSIQQNLDGFANYMNLKTDEAKTFALGCWDTIATTAAEKNQQWAQSFDEAKNRAGQSLEALKTWASGVWDSLAQGASAAASSISAKLSGAWDAVQGAAPSFSFDVGSIFDHNATGSTHFAGGWTEINERGGEAIWLPNGSWIYPHATTEKIIRQQLAGLMTMPEPQDIQLQAPAITLPAPAAILQEISPQMPAITLPDMPQNMGNPQQSSWQDIVQMPAVTPVVLDIPQAGSIEDNQPVDNTALIQPAEAAWAPLPGTARTSTEAAKQPASSDLRRAPAPQVTISGNTFMVREEADINRIAYELLKLMTTTNANFGGA